MKCSMHPCYSLGCASDVTNSKLPAFETNSFLSSFLPHRSDSILHDFLAYEADILLAVQIYVQLSSERERQRERIKIDILVILVLL